LVDSAAGLDGFASGVIDALRARPYFVSSGSVKEAPVDAHALSKLERSRRALTDATGVRVRLLAAVVALVAAASFSLCAIAADPNKVAHPGLADAANFSIRNHSMAEPYLFEMSGRTSLRIRAGLSRHSRTMGARPGR
jgi:hypothetical protein